MCQCTGMGIPWVAINPQTKRRVYLRLSFKFIEEWTEQWSDFKDYVDELQTSAATEPTGSIDSGVQQPTSRTSRVRTTAKREITCASGPAAKKPKTLPHQLLPQLMETMTSCLKPSLL